MAAVRWVCSEGMTLCASIGPPTWELILAIASLTGTRLLVHLPAADISQYGRLIQRTLIQFSLDRALVDFRPVLTDEPRSARADRPPLRDKTVADTANLLIPVSVRRGGHMQQIIERHLGQGKPVEESFTVPYRVRENPLAYELPVDQLNPKLATIRNRYLVHWTRAANGPWPTELAIDYYAAVIESQTYPRSAFCTLMNMLSGNRLVASDRHMPRSTPTVSFSGLSPVDTLPLMKWRARYRQMSFEPYGVGIDKDTAYQMGIRRVRYYNRRNGTRTGGVDPWLAQSRGQKSDWGAEDEYRHRGDLQLSSAPRDRLVAFCVSRSEAALIETTTGINTVSFLAC